MSNYINIDNIFSEISECLSSITNNDISTVIEFIKNSERIVTIGAGRMGYSLRAFAMRLSHIGYNAYHIGDTNIPRTDKCDLMIIGSGSGSTETILKYAEIAKRNESKIILFTHELASPIAKISDYVVSFNKIKTKQIMKTVYEQSTYLLYDKICSEIVNHFKLDIKCIENNHSILE